MFGGVEALWRGFVGEVNCSCRYNHLPQSRREGNTRKEKGRKKFFFSGRSIAAIGWF